VPLGEPMNRKVLVLVQLTVLLLCVLITAGAQSRTAMQLSVGPEGHGQFRTVQEAIDHASGDGGAIIRLASGVYREKVTVNKPKIELIGMGSTPSDTVITWGDSAKNTGSTFKSGTVTVSADGFEAENLSIVNTWWQDHPAAEDRSQAVALQMESDRGVIDRVRIVSGQDTLYANSHACRGELTSPCRADRQYFNDCFIEGNVDYIFGDAKAVFNRCELHSRRGSGVMVTAQSRHSPFEDSGYFMLHCRITGENQGNKIFLGRPWRDYAAVLFYDTEIVQKIDSGGWSEWGGRLKTATYREYKSHGPGANGSSRSVTYEPLSADEETQLTAATLLAGSDDWDPEAEVQQLRSVP
jgi:pectinesterase